MARRPSSQVHIPAHPVLKMRLSLVVETDQYFLIIMMTAKHVSNCFGGVSVFERLVRHPF